MAKHNWVLIGAVILVLAFATGIVSFSNGNLAFHLGQNVTTQGQTTALSGGPYNAQVSAFNGITGAAMTSLSTMNVFSSQSSTNKLDTSSASANPVQFGSQVYSNGGSYYVQIGRSSYATTLTPFFPTSWAPLSGGTTYQTLGNVYTVGTPTYVLKGSWSNGTTFTTSTSYNFTSGSQSATQQITFTLSNSAANTGWISAWDPANQQTTNLVCVINDTTTAQALSFQGYGTGQYAVITKGVAYYYTYIIPDGFTFGQGISPDGQPTATLTRAVANPSDIMQNGITTYQPISAGPIYGGQGSTFTITIGSGALSHGNSEAVGVECYQGGDVSVFNGPIYHYGNFGPDAVAKIQFTITFKK